MIYTYPLIEKTKDLTECIEAHSADETYVYKIVEGTPIRLGVYYPKNYVEGHVYPAFFFVHGGGWNSHKIFPDQQEWAGDHLGFLARYYANKGFVSISLDYRLLQENGHKENYGLIDLYEDCTDAVNYMLENAEKYRIDTKNVYLLGESAGGHLAGLLATKYKRENFCFKRSFLVNAIAELVEDEVWNNRTPKGLEKPMSPLYNISKNTSPVTLIHGLLDPVVYPKQSELFYQRMEEYGRECDVHWIEETKHAFLLAEYTKNQDACRIGIEIIDSYMNEWG